MESKLYRIGDSVDETSMIYSFLMLMMILYIIAATKHNFVAAVTAKTIKMGRRKKKQSKNHSTGQIWTTKERLFMIVKLTNDELFGPILLKFRGIVNSAVGLRKN